MYTLILSGGSTIENAGRPNKHRFVVKSDMNLYDKLNESNLSFVTILKDGELEDVYFDCKLQNYFFQPPWVEFRLDLSANET